MAWEQAVESDKNYARIMRNEKDAYFNHIARQKKEDVFSPELKQLIWSLFRRNISISEILESEFMTTGTTLSQEEAKAVLCQ